MKGFAFNLALKQRPKITRKKPVLCQFFWLQVAYVSIASKAFFNFTIYLRLGLMSVDSSRLPIEAESILELIAALAQFSYILHLP